MKIKELLSDKSKWTQGQLAKDKKGNRVSPTSYDAVCWCLIGATRKCYGEGSTVTNEVNLRLSSNLPNHFMLISEFNDAQETTFEQVKALVEKLNI